MSKQAWKLGVGMLLLAGLQACATDVPDEESQVEPLEKASAADDGENTATASSAMIAAPDGDGCTFIPYTCTWRVWYGCLDYGSCRGHYVNGVPICTTGCN